MVEDGLNLGSHFHSVGEIPSPDLLLVSADRPSLAPGGYVDPWL